MSPLLDGPARRDARELAQVALRAFLYWAAVAVPAVGAVLGYEKAERAVAEAARQQETDTRIDIARRLVVDRLASAQADLRLLGGTAAIVGYLADTSSPRRAAALHDLLAFVGGREWCVRLQLTPAAAAPLMAARGAEKPACADRILAAAARLPRGEALLERSDGAEATSHLCLGISLGTPDASGTATLVAEVHPDRILGPASGLIPDAQGPFLRDGASNWLVAPGTADRPLVIRPLVASGRDDPRRGVWEVAIAPVSIGERPPATKHVYGSLLAAVLAVAGLGAVALARSVSAGRRAERRELRQLALFQLVSDNVPSPVYLKDSRGTYRACNSAFEALVGRPRAEILGRTAAELLPPGEAQLHEETDRLLLREPGVRRYEICATDARGGSRDVLVVKSSVRDDAGRIVGVTASMLDITDHKATLRDLSRSLEQLRLARDAAEAGTQAKSEFLAMMSHEIRTPLNAVLGAVGLLLTGDLDREQRDQAEMAKAAGRALLELIDDILDFSRIEAGRLQIEQVSLNPRALFEDTVGFVAEAAHAKGLEIACIVAPEVPSRLTGDPGRLRQILLNLLTNAIKFTEQGQVVARVAAVQGRPGAIRLSVRDTGPGIEPATVARLFEPFTQGDGSPGRKSGGVGLGLAITKRLVTLMGGEISVASTTGSGAEFSCVLPLGLGPGDEPAPDLAGRRALVIGARPIVAESLVAQLAALGIDAVAELDATAALDRLADAGPLPDVLLLDERARMPDEVPTAAGAGRVRRAPCVLLGWGRASESRAPGRPRLSIPASTAGLRSKLVETWASGGAPAPESVGATAGDPKGARARRVLLVEDNLVNRRVACAQLERLGCGVDVATDGRQAIERAAGCRYDVIFMDCQMPGTDGFAATREIRRRERGERPVPIVAMTANALRGDRERCLAVGMTDYLAKPVDLEALASMLERHAPAAPDAPGSTSGEARGSSVIDGEAFARIRALEDEDSPGFLASLVRDFAETGTERIAEMRAALKRRDAAALRGAAHGLKGGSGLVGARGLADLCQKVEGLASVEDPATVEGLLGRLVREYEAVLSVLRTATAPEVGSTATS